MSKASAQQPPQVNAGNLIGQQGQANAAAAELQSGLNNVNVASPLGATFYTPTSIDPGTGHPANWAQTQQLSPASQGVFASQQSLAHGLADLAGTTAGTVAQSAGPGSDLLNTAASNLRGGPALIQKEVTDAQNAAYNTQAGYLNPQFAQKHSDLAQQLADQGISAGSNAFDRAQGDLGRQETLAYQQAQDAAVGAGNQEQNTLFNQQLGLGSLGQNILGGASSELPALGSLGNFTWAGGLPSQGSSSTVTPPNIGSIQSAANQGNLNSFAAGNQLNNQLSSSLGGLFGSLGGSNLLFGSGGPSAALGLGSGGLLGALFGNPAAAASTIATGLPF